MEGGAEVEGSMAGAGRWGFAVALTEVRETLEIKDNHGRGGNL